MRVLEFLEKFEAEYTLEEGRSFQSRGRAGVRRYLGAFNASRAVVIRADGKRYMCVFPADCVIDAACLRERLGASCIQPVDDAEMKQIFPACQSGAEPPFGALYGFPTLMDASMGDDEYITFPGETYDKAIVMTMAEYKRLASPRIFSFAHPAPAPVPPAR